MHHNSINGVAVHFSIKIYKDFLEYIDFLENNKNK